MFKHFPTMTQIAKLVMPVFFPTEVRAGHSAKPTPSTGTLSPPPATPRARARTGTTGRVHTLVALLLALCVASSASAAEKLPPGTTITTPDGVSGSLDATAWLIDREELNDAISTKTREQRLDADLKRCSDALAKAQVAPAPSPSYTPFIIGAWAVSVTGAFVGGAYVFSRL